MGQTGPADPTPWEWCEALDMVFRGGVRCAYVQGREIIRAVVKHLELVGYRWTSCKGSE